MHTVFALLCFVVVIHWLIFPYPSGLLHRHCGNLTIAQVPAKQAWWIWINTSCEFIMNDCITTTKQSTTKPCAYFLGYTLCDQATSTHLDHRIPSCVTPETPGYGEEIISIIHVEYNHSMKTIGGFPSQSTSNVDLCWFNVDSLNKLLNKQLSR